jgi:hypothetical protein
MHTTKRAYPWTFLPPSTGTGLITAITLLALFRGLGDNSNGTCVHCPVINAYNLVDTASSDRSMRVLTGRPRRGCCIRVSPETARAVRRNYPAILRRLLLIQWASSGLSDTRGEG